MKEADELKVSVVGVPGRWELVLEVNGAPWKRYGPWEDRDTADMFAAEALQRAAKVAEKLWGAVNIEDINGPGKKET